ncbi:hypothetical protein [Arthrobacter cavernae]|uniref:Uncharacterized protein n=1 Tax=Arthrobacter cavernae TaxID=2817681 RepID=A0A939HEC1_9MICC|nr:hypothetical protein [Arthrobacter cavernae]MBO1268296.1 hypothetical protein [Arthrobacter cavernae]
MEDPATLILNLTFLGTVGLAGLMFLLLGFLAVITLVIAGIARLVSIVLLAMVGVFPKRDTVPIMHLPPERPTQVPEPHAVPVAESPTADEPLPAAHAATVVSVPQRQHFFTSQGKHHPFVAALTHEPPVLNEKWAAAVAQADERAAARAKAAELPKIVVSVREVPAGIDGDAETAPREKASQSISPNGKTPQSGATKASPPEPVHGGSLTPASGARPRA